MPPHLTTPRGGSIPVLKGLQNHHVGPELLYLLLIFKLIILGKSMITTTFEFLALFDAGNHGGAAPSIHIVDVDKGVCVEKFVLILDHKI